MPKRKKAAGDSSVKSAAQLLGSRGGKARAESLTAAERSAQAKRASEARKRHSGGAKRSCECGKPDCPTCSAREYQRKRRQRLARAAKRSK